MTWEWYQKRIAEFFRRSEKGTSLIIGFRFSRISDVHFSAPKRDKSNCSFGEIGLIPFSLLMLLTRYVILVELPFADASEAVNLSERSS